MTSTETDRQRISIELRTGVQIVGDTIEADAFGIQVMRQGQPYGDRIPYQLVKARRYFKAAR